MMESPNEERRPSRVLFIAFGVMALPIVLLLTLGLHQLRINYLRLGLACGCFAIAIWALRFLANKAENWWPERSGDEIAFWTVVYVLVFCFLEWMFFDEVSVLGSLFWSFYMATIDRLPHLGGDREAPSGHT